MKFSQLPLKKQKAILITAEVFFTAGLVLMAFLIPKTSAWTYFKYILILAMIATSNKLRVIRNLEKGLSPYNIESKKYLEIIAVALSGAFALTVCLLLFHH